MRGLIENNWTESHISPESITFDEFVYRVNTNDLRDKKGQGCFYWADKKHISEVVQYYDFDNNPDKICFERIKVQ